MKRQQILITNDDGINALGLSLLAQSMSEVADVYVVSPELERSAMGHAITMHKPLHATPVTFLEGVQMAWRINGTPSDCVKLGIEMLLPEKPDLLLSGINHGSNLGRDIYYSGTVSAAMEGMFLGVPSMALSYNGDDAEGLKWAAEFTKTWVFSANFERPPKGILYNVNFPSVSQGIPSQMAWVRLGRREYANDFHKRVDPRGREYFWLAGRAQDVTEDTGTDVGALAAGFITITPLHMDATAYHLLPEKNRMEVPSWPKR
ncbi:5'/3'-nucleotidase SurE [Sulfobacillus thermosulfidooxidans]|uniref:5'/3'-nucleotidase SurE n=1 Tax=Sulfobacillus thermosulfidooxidans TaxID=28034 RepID=UPI00096B9F72|nr:5'/3'-nucleotidase SurE [Sulfobacillus thermosulfidooxidans]OLZ12240.1 5'/3'-nucleotidase SurE [Sulfobacillus thermosulfidooxidans]OLZ12979.1 5'/3'-nucleotidase SurE [Sulfobacillus thermosulfidooxidans]OLZ21780.1 5'/3'-nucleotidase SurE [Sulfobacillus thermosulfidooxidans]